MDLTYYNKTIDVANNFAKVAGVGLRLVDKNGKFLHITSAPKPECSFCKEAFGVGECSENCSVTYYYGSLQAQRFGGRYIFFCPKGFTYFVSPVIIEQTIEASIICGPMLMIEHDEFFQEDILSNYYFEECKLQHLMNLLYGVPLVTPERVHALSEILYASTIYISLEKDGRINVKDESIKTQNIISNFIHKIKTEDSSPSYPFEKEEALLDAMSVGDTKTAKALLNEILGYIFFCSDFTVDVIRLRVTELLVLLSRAAVRGGADEKIVFGLNYEYLNQLENLHTLEDITYWLCLVMNRFTEYVFNFLGVKHADVIFKTINFIKSNYMNKITLEDVAKHVYLSPTYFCKIFKDEIGCNFNTYLNNYRIGKSKDFLLNQNINIADVSYLVGYEDQSYFTKVFKKVTGMSPLRYKQNRGSIRDF